MWQFIIWIVGALFFLGLSWTFGYRAKDAWDQWHKKDVITIARDQEAGKGGDIHLGPGTYKAGDGGPSGKGGDLNIKAGDGGSISNK